MQAVEEKQRSETISKVLYPNDQGFSGKELRLKQQYFFVSASLQDIIRRFKAHHSDFSTSTNGLRSNSMTPPSIAVPELMRLLVDEEGLEWFEAWEVWFRFSATPTTRFCPKPWNVGLPQCWGICCRDILKSFMKSTVVSFKSRISHPGDEDLVKRVSLVEDGPDPQIRMPYLSIIGSHAVNGGGFAYEIAEDTVFRDFYKLFPERFSTKPTASPQGSG